MIGLRRLFSAAALGVALSASLAGCTGGSDPKVANVKAGELPKDGKWEGVWYSELYGYLHLKQSGNKLKGKWERKEKDRWGQIEGEFDGDLFRFTWTEYVRGLVGPNAKKNGKGYF